MVQSYKLGELLNQIIFNEINGIDSINQIYIENNTKEYEQFQIIPVKQIHSQIVVDYITRLKPELKRIGKELDTENLDLEVINFVMFLHTQKLDNPNVHRQYIMSLSEFILNNGNEILSSEGWYIKYKNHEESDISN